MGLFLSLTSVMGRPQHEVADSLKKYALSVEGGLRMADNLTIDNDNCCVLEEADGNTTIFNPYAFMEWEASSVFISKDLKAAVFSFHIHDGDLWMYTFSVNGVIVDQFNPIPDYWDDDTPEEEIQSWKGDANIIAKYVPHVNPAAIEKYLVRWNLHEDNPRKAYPDDQHTQEDFQLLDFMKKLKLPYPLNDDGNPKGQVYQLWTGELKIKKQPVNDRTPDPLTTKEEKKPWWKFW